MKQQWQKAEDEFDDYYRLQGKKAYVFKVPDAAEVFGRVGKIGHTRAVPSDRIVTHNGTTFFAEIKSTEKDKFYRSLLRTTQSAMAKQIIAAGGLYYVFVKALKLNRWFAIPYETASASPSIPWNDLEAYSWKT